MSRLKCYRTAFHYASGIENNKRMVQLLSQYGLSDNVYDKDGQTPLDFQERVVSEELQELIRINREQLFDVAEPNPWSWKVWTRIQSEKDTLKQLISYSNPFMAMNVHQNLPFHYHHHHNHHHQAFATPLVSSHTHSHSHHHAHSHGRGQSNSDEEYEDGGEGDYANENEAENQQCTIL